MVIRIRAVACSASPALTHASKWSVKGAGTMALAVHHVHTTACQVALSLHEMREARPDFRDRSRLAQS
jgi:hypothetical protein